MATPVTPTDVGTVATIEDLRDVAASGSMPVQTTICVRGYHAAGDGGGGMFRFDSSPRGERWHDNRLVARHGSLATPR